MHRRRADSEIHCRDFLRAKIAVEIGFDRGFDALGREHCFKCLANSFQHGAIGGQQTVIERESLVKLVVELFARLEREIVEVDRIELAGGVSENNSPLLSLLNLTIVKRPVSLSCLAWAFTSLGLRRAPGLRPAAASNSSCVYWGAP